MFIQTESTPNPATLKFLPGATVLATRHRRLARREARRRSRRSARRIFAVDGVAGVFLGSDFVTVTKADERRLGRTSSPRSSARSWSTSSPASR